MQAISEKPQPATYPAREYHVHILNKSYLMIEDFGPEPPQDAANRLRTVRVILDEDNNYSTISIGWWANRNDGLLNTMSHIGRKPSDAKTFNAAILKVFLKERRFLIEKGLIQEPIPEMRAVQ